MKDGQWLQALHPYGFLRGALRPEDESGGLRSSLRPRRMRVAMASRAVQHRQKALEQMHLTRTEGVSAITGKTGMTIIRAILAGERDSQVRAAHREKRCQHDQATRAKALAGHGRAEHLCAWPQAVEPYAFLQQPWRVCEQQIAACLPVLGVPAAMQAPRPAPARKRRARQRHTPAFELHASLESMTGVDLTQSDGSESLSALKIISEMGLDMTRWPTGKHCASWLGRCPGNQQAGGKRDRVRRKPTAKRAATALRMAAPGLAPRHSALGAYDRRMRARLGAPKAMPATAHQLARFVSSLLRYGADYVNAGQQAYAKQSRDRVLTNRQRKARVFGYQLVQAERIESGAPIATS